ncbi:MAG TPA: MBL fold metallo-hydrolase [Thermoleophilaceae bacterium]|nr:MBL fold metallo-hydrolase [Thermoleophilaceae bacterium]
MAITDSSAEADTEPVLNGVKVAEGVRRFDDGIVNWYLIEDGSDLTLVDAGFPADWSMLTTALGALDRRLSDLRAVVITHGHIDHIGFAERARREAGAEVLVHAADEPLLKSPAVIAKSERSPLRYLNQSATRKLMLKATLARAPLAKTVEEVSTFADGEVLERVPGRPRVIHTPGHTDGHCVLHLPERGVLFAGDALVTRNPYTGATGPRLVSAAATKDTAQALASLDRIAAVEADVILTGHGEPWRGGTGEAIRLARAAGTS